MKQEISPLQSPHPLLNHHEYIVHHNIVVAYRNICTFCHHAVNDSFLGFTVDWDYICERKLTGDFLCDFHGRSLKKHKYHRS